MNTPNQPAREKEIFERALELSTTEARQGFVQGACGGDANLLARVQTLLRANEASRGFLPDNPEGVTTPTGNFIMPEMTEKPGTIIGRYKLLQKIGEGGCGIVYMAEQEQPVRRRVALKVIKLGMDTKEVVARFEAERQAVAMMDHPNIAKVFDAGATETGRPYFVMELVRGLPITKYCDEAKLSAKARLELFIPVCHAIQHAHQKGIIHRDIKPSNVLVTINDGVAVPKVIDFGIAKATLGRLTDHTVFTAFEQFIGTPTYMSPEQAAMTSLDIDTRSDIYSLGVLLYELLTGHPPFDVRQLAQAGLDEIRRQIREVEPSRPSARISTMSGVEQTTTARLRQIEAPKLVNLLRGDLDWIVMRCLEKDRSRRYETATGLALDLQHHLHDEPVTARPPSTAYRFRKLVARNKLAVGATGVVATALVIGLVVSTWAYFNEKSARQFAVEAALAQKKASDFNRTLMIRSADQSRRADVSDNRAALESAKSDYSVAVVKDLIRGAESASAADKVHTRELIGPTATRLRQDAKIPPEAKQELCDTLGDLFTALDDYGQAELMYRQTLALRRALRGDGHPDTTAAMNKLIEVLKRQGKDIEAAKTSREAQAQREEYLRSDRPAKVLKAEARTLQAQGRFAEAENRLHEAITIAETNLGENYRSSSDLGLLARLRFDAGDLPTAKQLAEAWVVTEKNERPWHEAGTFGFMSQTSNAGFVPPYDAHTILGLVALRAGDRPAARAHLLRSVNGVTAQMKFQNKDLELAAALAAAGEQATVLRFLDKVRPRYVENLQARSFENALMTLGSPSQDLWQAATGQEHAAELDGWRLAVMAGKVPDDWQQILETRQPAPAAAAVPSSPVPLLSSTALAPSLFSRPFFPFSLLMLGWCATAIAPRIHAKNHLPRAAQAWLIAFCAARTLDCALFAGALLGEAFRPDFLVSLLVSFASWMLLWEFTRALTPGDCSRWETRIMRGILCLGIGCAGVMEIAGYTAWSSTFMLISLVSLLLLLLFTLLLAISIGLVAGRRLWRWQRTADLSRAQRLTLKIAAPLLIAHGFVSIFTGLIHDQASDSVAGAVFWANALLPWLLAAGFAWRGSETSQPTAQ